MMKKFLACILSVVLTCGLTPLPAFAGNGNDLLAGIVDTQDDAANATEAAGTADATQSAPYPERPDRSLSSAFSARSIGIGGHGAPFDPVISPFDSKTFVVDCDMGGVYVTHDEGLSWDIKSLGGRIWDIKADPRAANTFYAAGGGLWRSTDNGDSWSLIWPDPATVTAAPSMLNHAQSYYFSTDSFPDRCIVESIAIDSTDSNHIVALTTRAANYDGDRSVYESIDNGATFQLVASFTQAAKFVDSTSANNHIYVEPAASPLESRIVVEVPDGVFEVVRASAANASGAESDAGGVKALYTPAQGERLIDLAQVFEEGQAHYVVLETANSAGDAALKAHTHIGIWRTSDFADDSKRVDLSSELMASLPREYNASPVKDADGQRTVGTAYEITAHNAIGICAPTLDRMYLAYRTFDSTNPSVAGSFQGINGLVAFDSSRPAGSRFYWAYGLRLWWKDPSIPVTPDQNMLQERAHSDASYTMLGMAADPNNPKRLVLATHASLMYSPDIDVSKVYSAADNRSTVNLYPRYAQTVAANPDDPKNPSIAQMRSTGLEVTVANHVSVDPFDEKHLLLGMDDAGIASSYDKGETWYRLYTNLPSGVSDTCFDAVFDEGKRDVVYALWHQIGGPTFTPSAKQLQNRAAFARSTDGGKTWDTNYASGLPEKATFLKISIFYPRDANGAITDGERTIYVAALGHGFYVSRDSGRTFTPMNAGIPTHKCGTHDAVWARDVQVTPDGRVFGMTQYSSLGTANSNGSTTFHSTQDAETFGNVWEWDSNASGGGAWVRLPLNEAGSVYTAGAYTGGVQVRQPRAMCYDVATRTLYVAGVCCIGSWVTSSQWNNFGGGLYAYTSEMGTAVGSGEVRAIDAASPLLGNERSLTGIGRDSSGRMWLATEDGEVYFNEGVKSADNARTGWTQVMGKTLRICHGFDFSGDGTVYFTTRGAGAFRIDPTANGEQGDQGEGSGEQGDEPGGSGEGSGGTSGQPSGGQTDQPANPPSNPPSSGNDQPTAHAHKLERVEASTPTCLEAGLREHWRCADCGQLFADAQGAQAATIESLAIEPRGHEWGAWTQQTPPTCTEVGSEIRACIHDATHVESRAIAALGHIDDGGRITRAATSSTEGEITHTCTRCGEVLSRTPIPKFVPPASEQQRGEDGTAFGRGASLAVLQAAVGTLKSSADPAGTSFAPLRARQLKAHKRAIALRWAAVSHASGYAVYAARDGKANRLTYLGTTRDRSFTHSGLKAATCYKYLIVALDSRDTVLASSKIVRISTAGGATANARSVDVHNARKLRAPLAVGSMLKLKATANRASGKLSTLRFESTNPAIARVTAKGKLRAIAPGTCKIYAFAQNGTYTCMKLTVR